MLGISVWAFAEPAILKRVFENLTLPPLAKQAHLRDLAFCSMRNGNNGPTKISKSWESRGVYAGKGPLQLLAVVLASLLIVSSALAGELGALCSAAKDFVTAAKSAGGHSDHLPDSKRIGCVYDGLCSREEAVSCRVPHRDADSHRYRPKAEAGNCRDRRVPIRLPGIGWGRGAMGSQGDSRNAEAI